MGIDLVTLALAKGYADKQIKEAEMGSIVLDSGLAKTGYAADAAAVGKALATKISFTEAQELTAEQKMQVKENIGAFVYDWHGVLMNPSSTIPGKFIANVSETTQNVSDWDKLLSLTSAVDSRFNLLYRLDDICRVSCFPSHLKHSDDVAINHITNYIFPELDKMIDEGVLIPGNNGYVDWYYVHTANTGSIHGITEIKISYDKTNGVLNLIKTDNSRVQRYWYMSGYGFMTNTQTPDVDTTLTVGGAPADAKVVGEALTLKADIPSETDAIELATELELISPAAADDGSIYTDENGAIYSL